MKIINNWLRKLQEKREARFRERIDRVYFHTDGHGNRFIKGHLYAVNDDVTGQKGGLTACLEDIGLDKAQSIVEHTRFEFETQKKSLAQSKEKPDSVP